jgi:hypothetical protein
MSEVGIVEAAREDRIDLEIGGELFPVPIAVQRIARKEVLVVLGLGELAIRNSNFDLLVLAAEKLQDHDALVTCEYFIVAIYDGNFDDVEFFEALF